MGKSLDSSCIVPPFRRTQSVRLVVIGTIVIIVPFFMLLLVNALKLLMLVFNPVTCISTTDDIA
jgi:hypothetical protein